MLLPKLWKHKGRAQNIILIEPGHCDNPKAKAIIYSGTAIMQSFIAGALGASSPQFKIILNPAKSKHSTAYLMGFMRSYLNSW